MEKHSKKQWQKPELTVVVRGTPAENVLEGCKTQVQGDISKMGGVYNCMNPTSGAACRGNAKS
jgi:hypothetical protein